MTSAIVGYWTYFMAGCWGCDLTLPYVLAAGARNSLRGMFLCHWLPTNRTLSAPHIRNLISSASDCDFTIQHVGYDKKALPVVAPGQHRRVNRLGIGRYQGGIGPRTRELS